MKCKFIPSQNSSTLKMWPRISKEDEKTIPFFLFNLWEEIKEARLHLDILELKEE